MRRAFFQTDADADSKRWKCIEVSRKSKPPLRAEVLMLVKQAIGRSLSFAEKQYFLQRLGKIIRSAQVPVGNSFDGGLAEGEQALILAIFQGDPILDEADIEKLETMWIEQHQEQL